MSALELAADQEVELLLGGAELEVGPDLDRVPSLHERVEQLVHADRLLGRHPLREVVALEQPGNRVLGSQL